ncbi:MAG TPA: GNAT family N-acetyltransferase [Candidatus Dormibacteraeota bacterium]|nr:GNAT family N-acetyltransferase [Candidatus Dormibacteraeota bacterium]
MPPVGGPRRRILVEARDASVRRAARTALTGAGFEVCVCPGPGPGHPCPLLLGEACSLVDRSDVVVHALPGTGGRAVRDKLRPDGSEFAPELLVLTGWHGAADAGDDASLPTTARDGELVEAVNRLHGRRVRFLRLPVTLRDGRRVVIRAVRPQDSGRLRAFDAELSPRSRQLRYLGGKPPMTEEWARHLSEVDFDRRFALVATAGVGAEERIVADCRLLSSEEVTGELAVVVADDHQGLGLGRLLVDLTLRVAAARGLPRVFADVRYDNRPMALLLRSEGFQRTGWELGVMTFARTWDPPVPR